jgi:hypothetical protein
MSNLKLEVDVKAISDQFGELKTEVEKALMQGVESLSAMTHAKVLELARDNLSSLSQKYMDAVSYQKLEEGLWVVALDMKKAGWIEEGRKSGFMDELLTGKSAKSNAKGEKYAVIPFQHNKNPSEQSTKAKELADQIKNILRSEGINWKKIEKNADGSPRVGLLHKINVNSPRLKEAHKSSPTQGIAVYQRKGKDGNVRKEVMTFRVIHERHRNEGLWIHPGREASKFLDAAFDWATQNWEQQILPQILDSVGKKVNK